jgi:hypothetical protein
MNTECKKEFTRNFLIHNFNKTYINTEYKEHLKDIYFQKEISKLPETICILNASKKHKNRQHEIKKLLHNKNQEVKEYLKNTLEINKQIEKQLEEQLEFYFRLYQLYKYCSRQTHYIDIENEPTNLQEIDTYFNQTHVSNKKYIPKYVGRCPSETCKGFINTKYICELCNLTICDKCNVPINVLDTTTTTPTITTHPHICDETLVSTIQLIKKDTKPCPTCHVNIYKIDGCDQMWCVECHTAFSWTTGEIEHKIHNPHYYEYLRNSNQHEKLLLLHNNNINRCNENEEEYEFLYDFVMKLSIVLRSLSIYQIHFAEIKRFHDLYLGIYRTLSHIEQVEIPIVFRVNTSNELDNLRMNYALNKITDEYYKSKVHQIYKKNAYNEDITQLLQTFTIIIKDLLKIQVSKLTFEKNTIKIEDLEIMRIEFIELYGWVDTKLEELSQVFNYTTLCLAHDTYVPGCTIKSKSRVNLNNIGIAGFDIIY